MKTIKLNIKKKKKWINKHNKKRKPVIAATTKRKQYLQSDITQRFPSANNTDTQINVRTW